MTSKKLLAGMVLLMGLIMSVVLLTVTYMASGAVIAIKASYPFIGVGVAALLFIVFYTNNLPMAVEPRPHVLTRLRWYQKGVWSILLLSIIVTAITNKRSVALLIGLPAAYTLLVAQLRYSTSSTSMIPQLMAVFSISPLSKYMTAGFYFGNGDLLRHIQYTDEMVQSGFVSAISSQVYQFFPGLHVITGSVALVTDLPIYDSLLLLGIITYTFSVALVFLIALFVTSNTRLSLSISYAASILTVVSYHSTYFFPQSFAVVLGLFLLFVSFRSTTFQSAMVPMTIISVVLSVALALVHHFTFLLFAPIIAVLLAPSLLESSRVSFSEVGRDSIIMPRFMPLAIAGIIAVSYWVAQKTFIGQFIFATSRLLHNQILVSGGGNPALLTYTIGTTLPRQDTGEAFRSLLSATGIYSILLVSLFAFGVAVSVAHWRKYYPLIPFLVVGILGSLLVFKTPALLSNRLGLPVSFFFSFVIGLGIYHLTHSDELTRSRLIIALIVLVLLSTTASVAAADDLYALNSGPDLVDLHSGPKTQKEFSTREYVSLRKTSEFINEHNVQASTFWITRVGLSRFGSTSSDQVTVSQHSIRTRESFFIYRNRWPQHQVYINGAGSKIFISEKALSSILCRENKVYTVGDVGILGNRGGDVLG